MEAAAKPDNFILAVNGDDDILEVLTLTIDQQYAGKVVTAKSNTDAIAILERHHVPDCIISDDRIPVTGELGLYQYVKNRNIACPFIVCTNRAAVAGGTGFSEAYGVIQGADFVPPLKQMLDEIFRATPAAKRESEFSPVRLSVLLRLGFVNFDLYMKLSETKFVKVSAGEAEFAIEDAQRLIKKKVIDLYLKKADAEKLLLEFHQNIMLLSQDSTLPSEDMVGISNEAYQMTLSLSQSLGWSKEVQDLAQQGTQIAVSAIAKNPSLLNLLNKMNRNEDSYLATHSHLLTFLCCGTAKQLEWTSEYTYTKLAMAALLHDITLTRDEEQRIHELNAAAYDPANQKAEVELYRAHPSRAVLMLSELRNLPPDIDKVIIQHHERPDGTGFPGRVPQNRINPLSALFIVAEDLVDRLMSIPNTDAALRQFVAENRKRYTSGHFLKVFHAIEACMKDEES